MKKIPLYEVREIKDIKQLFNDSCKIYAGNTAFMQKRNSDVYENITYSEAQKDVDGLGTAFGDLGLDKKRIAIIGENRYEWAISYLATITGTNIVVPLDRQLSIMELKNCLKRANVSAVIYSPKVEEKINEVKKELQYIKHFISMDNIYDLINKGKEKIERGYTNFQDVKINENEMRVLLFTSGTTSESKAVMLSHKNIVANLRAQCQMIKFTPEDTFLSILPLHHCFECTCGFLNPIYRGATIAYCEGLRHIQKNMQEVHPTTVLAVPLIYETMYKKIWETIDKKGKTKLIKSMIKFTNTFKGLKKKVFKEIHKSFGGNIKILIAGAAAISPEVSKGYRDFGINLIQGYGLTECSPIVTLNRTVDYNDKSIGYALPDMEVKIENANEEGIGEIVAKGENVMLGYYQNPNATKEVIKNGWFYTGDLGYMDEKGFFYITGRKKNVIITKNGKNVYPEEIESMLNKSLFIKESMLCGKEGKNDTKIHAKIVLDEEYIKDLNLTKEELKEKVWNEIKLINENLVIYKHVTGFDIMEKEFEKTTTMKIKRYIESEKQ